MRGMMTKTKEMLTLEELVKQKFPDAFVEDDGQWVYIMNKKTVTEPCPHCGQDWTHKVIDFGLLGGSLGSGNCAENAWKNTAESLGLT